ncbi:MAG: type II toxin-antitoxin system VapC family toxin [Microbacterium sp.]
MQTSAEILLDTSAALALLRQAHPSHEAVTYAVRGRTLGLAGHALIETYSVLTRLPGQARITPNTAGRIIAVEFPACVALPPEQAVRAIDIFTSAGIAGGAVYDGLVGLAAKTAGLPLLTCDRRAVGTYAALRVDVHFI